MVVMHTPNLSSVKTKARKSGGEGQPQVHIKFKASLHYKRPCLKKKKKNVVHTDTSRSAM